ncbi:response regulator transcription factor [Paenibacillus wynnii]|uniref:response regulator transcription factor n=1 Tax=Paenibacillus wynnii TaxID=268407 RepID=UPI0027939925|nr:response regulator transcription factor [Paenibacillus wynnii]MDQ0193927.1 CheY-like chemotaxis protein [Paenibacillus wynnii]
MTKPSKKLQDAFEFFLTYYEAGQISYGIILVESQEISEKQLQEMKIHFGKEDSLFAQYYYDNESSILAILIDNKKLSFTHYHSLIVKSYLQERNLLAGQILIASFPENGESPVQILNDMLDEMSKGTSEVGEIRIFNFESLKTKSQKSILVVNDDVTVNEYLGIFLQQKGYQLYFAQNGKEGIEEFVEHKPDLVITELNLPIIDGYQLINRINSSGTENRYKIMVLTDKRLDEDIQKSFQMGVSDYMIKPFSPIELAVRIKRLLQENDDKGEV